jgi:electron transport complex protein RnfB
MDTETRIYRELQKRLDSLPSGFRTTESGSDIRILKRFFTPEEAQVAIQLSMKPEPLKRLHRRVKNSGITIEQLQRILDRMLLKGTVIVKQEGYREKHYCNAEFGAGGIYDFQVDRLTEDMIQEHKQYLDESRLKAKPGQKRLLPLRTIPVAKSVPLPGKYQVSDYDSIREIINNSTGKLAVANCICRQSRDITGEKCTKTDLRETCLMIETDHARQYVDMGIGRYITSEEAIDILEKVQSAGLVLQPANSQRPDAICCCCGDCCALLKSVKNAPRPVDLYASNYYVEVASDLCNGCELCVERCQLDARVMLDGIATVNLDRCIGCGNCVTICPSGANQLQKKHKEIVPPKNQQTLYLDMLANKVSKWDMLTVRLKMWLGMKV